MDCVINKERLMDRIPHQLRLFTENELNQKINAYFIGDKIKNLNDLLKVAKIKKSELDLTDRVFEKDFKIKNLNKKLKKIFEKKYIPVKNPFKILLVDLSTYYSTDSDKREYNVLEPPLGLMSLMTYLNKRIKNQIKGRIIKSLIDFDSNEELLKKIVKFSPHLIGIRAMTFYSGFLHDTIKHLRTSLDTPIIVGGPYPTASYSDILKDRNINAVAIAEGEITLLEIVKKMINNNYEFLNYEELSSIDGIAYYNPNEKSENPLSDNLIASIPLNEHIKSIIKTPFIQE